MCFVIWLKRLQAGPGLSWALRAIKATFYQVGSESSTALLVRLIGFLPLASMR